MRLLEVRGGVVEAMVSVKSVDVKKVGMEIELVDMKMAETEMQSVDVK